MTWGVFPAREILQPTVVDPDAFLEWKSEAFALWRSHWAAIYDEDAPAADVLHEMIETYFLVNVVDHDYIGGDIFAVFEEALVILQARAAAGTGGVGARLAAEATAAAGAPSRPLPSVPSGGSTFATPAWALLPPGGGTLPTAAAAAAAASAGAVAAAGGAGGRFSGLGAAGFGPYAAGAGSAALGLAGRR